MINKNAGGSRNKVFENRKTQRWLTRLVWCRSGIWIPCWLGGCLLWLLGAMMCIWCAERGRDWRGRASSMDKLLRFTFMARFELLEVRRPWFKGWEAATVPTLLLTCGENALLSVVGAEGFEEQLCEEAKSLPDALPPPPLAEPPPLPPMPAPADAPEPAELEPELFEHLRHLGSHEFRRMNFRYSFRTCEYKPSNIFILSSSFKILWISIFLTRFLVLVLHVQSAAFIHFSWSVREAIC